MRLAKQFVLRYENNTMKNNLKYAFIIILVVCSAGGIFAQIPIRKDSASADEIIKAKTTLEADLNNQKAHETYIYAMGLNNPMLDVQYRSWVEKYPENAIIPLAIGTVYYKAEMSQGKFFLEKAALLEPNNANIWYMLSIDAFTRGQNSLSSEYMRKAALAGPTNVSYASAYLMSFKDTDPDYKQKVFDFVKKYPESERGAQVLYWLAERDTIAADRIEYFEDLRNLYPPQKFKWSASGMIHLTDDYLQTDPEKALALIDIMGGGKDWSIRKQVAESLITVDKLQQNQKYTDALIELEQVKLPKFNYINNFIALKKAALQERSGGIKAAYDSVAIKFAKLPTDQLFTALEFYGSKTGKNKDQVAKDIQTIRNSIAVSAYPFDLGLYTRNSKLSLKSLRGKIVLLTFWFPACGPCREEFPHFQAVIDKFKGKNVVYIGINVFSAQDPYVAPFMQNTKYSFIPLRGSSEFAATYYGVQSEPESFLIDKEGKIIFKDFRINAANERTLELMISSLL